mmetsp:Transcript_29931/g.64085  ORF Transcript_29931/g.64085 Transcript_29931/m.64085 type:complete len:453 (+) Transcript_29931:317-1675(+)|eukprot:CAMPEP_0201131294 /NCGR_PEP_ID=MMETSP0850-20130426/42425_1 /ASSEMBLY_ACC=CAM_ASM_000622 /TAXON_ID=183588 /ORGANISM="Pseudo-nitzschia fraudulenta, Strain WWA7" /LENGTH=452 /DNA_ID=CAMNT_0047401301 /DNA_START=318 /DNA_END=1676 /DNA_ORIENTATION=+
MKFTNSVLTAFLLVATTSVVDSFTFSRKANDLRSVAVTGRTLEPLFLSPEDLTNYMAKAHEEKIRAIKEVEDKKNGEIQTLKGEVKLLKESKPVVPKESAVVVSSPPSTGMDLSSMTKAELQAKLIQYQEFMAKYIVQAQQQKMKAVLAAEMATAAKYEAKIKILLASADGAAPAKAETAAPSSSAETKLYDTRSANVAAAAKAGKSRWGDKEVAKVQIKKGADLDVKSEPADDAVNGKANGVSVAAPSPISLPGSSLYDTRNKSVAAAGKAGRSRWGDAEVKRATEETLKPTLSSSAPAPEAPGAAAPVVKTPEIEAADHGLRNDGGVGGPSLAERVNLGQQLFTASDAAAEAPIAVISIAPSAYDLRNAKIAAAAAAGKSRWGSMENSKATVLAAESSSKALGAATAAVATKPVIQVSPEVEAADHGLRNDGGVGGPSLAERVNLGSGLF